MGEQQARSRRRSSFKNLSKSTSSSGTRALARGSSSMVGTRNTPSQLSTFQMSEEQRTSQIDLITGPRPKVVDNSKAYMIAVIFVLLAAVGVLVFLLAM